MLINGQNTKTTIDRAEILNYQFVEASTNTMGIDCEKVRSRSKFLGVTWGSANELKKNSFCDIYCKSQGRKQQQERQQHQGRHNSREASNSEKIRN